MSNKPLNNLCRANGPVDDLSTHTLCAFVAALRALEEVTAAYAREEGKVALVCTVCSEAYVPEDPQPRDICLPCLDANFSGAQPPLGWAEVEAAVLALTPRQVQALARITARQRARQQEDTP